MNTREIARILPVMVWGLGFTVVVRAQTPTITSVFGQSPHGNATGITSGPASPSTFVLLINGSFNPGGNPVVVWKNTVTNATQSYFIDGGIVSNTATQIQVLVSNNLYANPVAAAQPVQITVTEGTPTVTVSNVGNFRINPPLNFTPFNLAPGTAGTAYSEPLFTGGTPPYSYVTSGLPPGLSPSASSPVLAGTPTTPGLYFPVATITDTWDNTQSSEYSVQIYAQPVIIPPLVPSSAAAGTPGLMLTINGTGFFIGGGGASFAAITPDATITTGSRVSWTTPSGSVTLFPDTITPTKITVTLPASLLAVPVVATVRVVQPNGAQSNPATFTVFSTLSIATTALPGANANAPYNFLLTASGGAGGYRWAASGLPGGLVLNTTTGAITGSSASAGSFSVLVTVTDAAAASASKTFPLVISQPPPPPLRVTASLPQGQVNVPYGGSVGASGGTGPYTFGLAGGSLPGGLILTGDGAISGTPTTAGTFRFTASATDATGASASADFALIIIPPPLTLTGTVSDTTVGAAINTRFGATGGTPPYTLSISGAIPSGTTFSNGTLSGTTNSLGTFTFVVSVTDAARATASQSFTIKVGPPALTISGTPGNGQAGVAYSAQLTGAGGAPPYTWEASGLPDGITFSGGIFGGIPTLPGKYSVGVTLTDAAGNRVSTTFSITIDPGLLTITTATLGNGVLGSAFTATLAASGGVAPYSWSVSGLPGGLTATGASIRGTPDTLGTFTVTATVTDSLGGKASRNFTVVIAAPPLVITTEALPGITVGTGFTITLGASGGIPPYRWSATGLPGGVTLDAGGVLAGTTTAPGTASIAVTVTDSANTSTSRSLSLTSALPAIPTLSFTGLPPTSNPASQQPVTVGMGAAYPVDVTVELTLTFAPDTGADDPAIQFSTGGRTARVIVSAGTTSSTTQIGVQTGTVAGTITITARLSAAGQDLTPSPPPTRTIRINATAPVITSVTANRTATGFTVTAVGYTSSREMTQAVFTFTPAAGSTLQTTTVTVQVDAVFAQWFGSAAAAAFGGQFSFTQPFTITGNQLAITSVSITLANRVGNSNTANATIQ